MRKFKLTICLVTIMVGLSACGKQDTQTPEGTQAPVETVEPTAEPTAEPSVEESVPQEPSIDLSSVDMSSPVADILAAVYANADLDSEVRDAMTRYQNTTIEEDSKEYILGTTELSYEDSVFSAPMMSSIAYQCVMLRVSEGTDIDAAKQLLLDNADPRKWICVEAESVIVENVDDVILFIMADTATAEAIQSSFLAMAE